MTVKSLMYDYVLQERVRKGIHVGDREFNKGYASYTFLNQSVMVSKKPWLNDILERGEIEVLVYNGNLDVIVHVMGTNKVVKSLSWARKEQFEASTRKIFWVWNEDDENGNHWMHIQSNLMSFTAFPPCFRRNCRILSRWWRIDLSDCKKRWSHGAHLSAQMGQTNCLRVHSLAR